MSELSSERIKELGAYAFGIDLNFDGALMKFARAIEKELRTGQPPEAAYSAEHVVDFLRERADWIDREIKSGGDLKYLSVRYEECKYIARCIEDTARRLNSDLRASPAAKETATSGSIAELARSWDQLLKLSKNVSDEDWTRLGNLRAQPAATPADELNGWIQSHVTPPTASKVLVYYPSAEYTEVTLGKYVASEPSAYPYWRDLPAAPRLGLTKEAGHG